MDWFNPIHDPNFHKNLIDSWSTLVAIQNTFYVDIPYFVYILVIII